MGVSVSKKKAGKAALFDSGNPEVDQLADLLAWEKTYKDDPRFKELEALKKKICALEGETADPAAPLVAKGQKYEVEWSPCANESTVIDIRKMQKDLGDDVFYAIVKVPVDSAKKYLTAEQQNKHLNVSQTGSRRIKGARLREL